MFNPFYPLTLPLLEALVQKGKRYFVRQRFIRGLPAFRGEIQEAFLVSHYELFVTAQDHLGAIGYDRYRRLYDWENQEDRVRLQKAAKGIAGYAVFTSLLRPDWEKAITNRHREKIRAYVSKLGWQPKGKDTVDTAYEVRFGELFIRLRYQNREVTVKLQEVEQED